MYNKSSTCMYGYYNMIFPVYYPWLKINWFYYWMYAKISVNLIYVPPRYSWNIVGNGVKHCKSNQPLN
jgi:hypothetical protein